jgi:hypothetical protein
LLETKPLGVYEYPEKLCLLLSKSGAGTLRSEAESPELANTRIFHSMDNENRPANATETNIPDRLPLSRTLLRVPSDCVGILLSL